jgi:hypothetical protein
VLLIRWRFRRHKEKKDFKATAELEKIKASARQPVS